MLFELHTMPRDALIRANYNKTKFHITISKNHKFLETPIPKHTINTRINQEVKRGGGVSLLSVMRQLLKGYSTRLSVVGFKRQAFGRVESGEVEKKSR